MQRLQDVRFFMARPEQASFRDFEIENAQFDGCFVPGRTTPGDWREFSNIILRDASQTNCSLDTCSFIDVSLHNLKRTGDAPLFLWGCVFRRVTLSGRVSGIKINRSIGTTVADYAAQPEWDAHVLKFYDATDWALDISKAEFAGGITFEALPGDMVRRDPTTQILIRRQVLARTDWSGIDFDNTAIDLTLRSFDRSQFDSQVLAARIASKYAKMDLKVFQRLRDAGIAEPV